MIYDYGSIYSVWKYLQKNLPNGSIVKIGKGIKLEKLAKKDDMVIFYGWGNGDRKTQRVLLDRGVKVVLDGETSLKLGNKVCQLKAVDAITSFPLERVYIENNTKELREYRVPKLNNSELIVLKIGNSHQGRDKYLKRPNALVRTKENVIYEEYVGNSRSIRVLIIKDAVWVVEHKAEEWIKNTNPVEEVYEYDEISTMGIEHIEDIIEDARALKIAFNMDYVGVDYVVNNEKIGVLEVNDMIGLPENDNIEKAAQEYWFAVCMVHIQNNK